MGPRLRGPEKTDVLVVFFVTHSYGIDVSAKGIEGICLPWGFFR